MDVMEGYRRNPWAKFKRSGDNLKTGYLPSNQPAIKGLKSFEQNTEQTISEHLRPKKIDVGNENNAQSISPSIENTQKPTLSVMNEHATTSDKKGGWRLVDIYV